MGNWDRSGVNSEVSMVMSGLLGWISEGSDIQLAGGEQASNETQVIVHMGRCQLANH
jgi:hypothetical protein